MRGHRKRWMHHASVRWKERKRKETETRLVELSYPDEKDLGVRTVPEGCEKGIRRCQQGGRRQNNLGGVLLLNPYTEAEERTCSR